MNNLFISPNGNDIKAITNYFMRTADYRITLDSNDFEQTLINSENALVIDAYANGINRIDTIVDKIRILASKSANNYDIYSAKKVLFQLSIDKFNPLMKDETSSLTDFFAKFNNSDLIWGVSQESIPTPDTICLKIIIAGIPLK